jgi:homocysteine S-methyltransferase
MAPMSLKTWFTDETVSSSFLLLDGGVSTHLQDMLIQQRRVDPDQQVWSHRSLWSSSLLLTEQGRSDIERGHLDWLHAGSNIITTVTYQCHYSNALPNTKHIDSVDNDTMTQMLRDGVQLAKTAISHFAKSNKNDSHTRFVVASSGCFGAALANGAEYTGHYPGVTEADLIRFHRQTFQILLQEKPDGIAFETIPSLFEFVAVLKLLLEEQQKNENFPSLAIWLSLACRSGSELNDGRHVTEVLDCLREFDPDVKLVHAIGFNCCDIQFIPSLIQIAVSDMATHKGSRRGVVFYPNSGEQWDASTGWKEGTTCAEPMMWADRLVRTVNLIQEIWNRNLSQQSIPKIVVGGCCRTTPETIAVTRKLLDERASRLHECEQMNTSQSTKSTSSSPF